jgi:diamine N-acetyltransferase
LDTPFLDASLGDASQHPTFACYGVYDEDSQPVGFISFGYEPEDPTRGWIPLLLIDERYQHRGYGRAAILEAIRCMSVEIPGCVAIGLSYKPKNEAAAAVYRSLGFVPPPSWRQTAK